MSHVYRRHLDKLKPMRKPVSFKCCKPTGRKVVMHRLATPFEAKLHIWGMHADSWMHPNRVQRHSTFVIIRSQLGFYLPRKYVRKSLP